MEKPNLKKVGYTITEETLNRLSEAKKGERWSKSQFVENAIKRELERTEREG